MIGGGCVFPRRAWRGRMKCSRPALSARTEAAMESPGADLRSCCAQEMEVAVLRAGGEARGDTIVAGGDQACDPHERGHGPLFANQLIILDIFPRHARSGLFR